MKRYISWGFFGVIALVGFFLNSRDDKIIDYNDEMVAILLKHVETPDTLRLTVASDGMKKDLGVQELLSELDKLTKATGELRSKYNALKVPDYPECKAFHQSAGNYITASEKICKTYTDYFALGKNKDGDMKATAEKMRQLQNDLQSTYAERDQMLVDFDAKQKAMAAEFGFELK